MGFVLLGYCVSYLWDSRGSGYLILGYSSCVVSYTVVVGLDILGIVLGLIWGLYGAYVGLLFCRGYLLDD